MKRWRDLDRIGRACGAGLVDGFVQEPGSVSWGSFDKPDDAPGSLAAAMASWRARDARAPEPTQPFYAFDLDAKCACPELLADFELLEYFQFCP